MCGICSFSFSICPFTQSYVMLDIGSYPRGSSGQIRVSLLGMQAFDMSVICSVMFFTCLFIS